MKITRQQFLLVVALSIFALPAFAQSNSTSRLALVGTYTTKTNSKGIYALDFDSTTGKMSPPRLVAETPDPSWIAIHPNGKWAYAANEAGKTSAVTSFALDAATGKLTQLNQLPAQGEDPCYLSFDKTGKFLFVANYTSGNVVAFPILPDGKLGPPTANVKDQGALGPNKERQEGPHAHWIGARGNLVFVADLGLDRVLLYWFDPAKGTLRKAPGPDAKHPFSSRDLELNPGTGPRHVAFSSSKNGHSLTYVLGELDSTISLFATTIEGNYSGLPGQKITMLPSGFSGRNEPAEITVHPSGKWLFASNRGKDSIAVFSIDPQTGAPKQTGDYPTGGKEPRHFTLDPSGNFLLAENQNSDSIVEYRFDPVSGTLTPTGQSISVPSPVCLAFLPSH